MNDTFDYRVAHVVGNLDVGGGQKLTALIARGLHDRGVDVTVVSLGRPSLYTEYLLDAGVPVVSLGLGREGTTVDWRRAPRAAWDLGALLRRERFDIVHTHMFRTAVLTTGLARLTGSRALGTSHRIYFDGIQPVIERTLSVLQDAIVVDSAAVGQILQARTHIPPDKYVAIHNGIDPQEFQDPPSRADARRDLGLPDGVVLVGCVAHLEPHKGQRYLIEAVSRLRASGRSVEVVLVGSGSDESQLRMLSRELGLWDHVHFLGVRTDLPLVLSALDVLALPSVFEGFGIVQAEGMLLGLPVLSTNAGGALEVVADGETGFLVPFGDVDAITARLSQLVDDPELRADFGVRGRERILSEFSLDRMVDSYLRLYERVLSKSDG